MIISPIFIGGLGNRLYQLSAAAYLAHRTKFTLCWRDLEYQYKSLHHKLFGCFKVEDMLENGGHPTKYTLSEVFDIQVGDAVDRVYMVLDLDSGEKIAAQKETGTNIIHTHGYFMYANIVEYVISRNIFPRWSLKFSSLSLP